MFSMTHVSNVVKGNLQNRQRVTIILGASNVSLAFCFLMPIIFTKTVPKTSLFLFSMNDKPLSIEDPPCSLSDVPTVTPENTHIVRGKSEIDQYDALRYLITSHLKTPIIQDFDKSTTMIVDGVFLVSVLLITFRRSFQEGRKK